MAMTSAGFELRLTLFDKGANQTSLTYKLTSADAAAAATDTATILAALAGVSALTVGKYFLSEVFENDAFTLPSSADAQAEVGASITTFIDNKGSKKANYNIPGPIVANVFQSTTGDDSNKVKTSSAQVIAYQGLFSVGGPAYISDGEVAGAIISGVRVSKRKRGG